MISTPSATQDESSRKRPAEQAEEPAARRMRPASSTDGLSAGKLELYPAVARNVRQAYARHNIGIEEEEIDTISL